MKSDNLITKRIRLSLLPEIGPGGFDCPCCCPPAKEMGKLNRRIRHKMKQELKREINQLEEEDE